MRIRLKTSYECKSTDDTKWDTKLRLECFVIIFQEIHQISALHNTRFFARGQRAFKLVLKSIKEEEGGGREERRRKEKEEEKKKKSEKET